MRAGKNLRDMRPREVRALPVGTKLIAVDVDRVDNMTPGRTYLLSEIPGGEMLAVVDDSGEQQWFYHRRFALAEPDLGDLSEQDLDALPIGTPLVCVDASDNEGPELVVGREYRFHDRRRGDFENGDTRRVIVTDRAGVVQSVFSSAGWGFRPSRFRLAEPASPLVDATPLDEKDARIAELEGLIERVRVRMVREARSRGWCDDFNRIASEVGLDLKMPTQYRVTLTTKQNLTRDVEATSESEARRLATEGVPGTDVTVVSVRVR